MADCNRLDEYRATITEDNSIADPGALNAALADQQHTSASIRGAIARNAALLGYKTSLQREQHKLFPSTEEQTMNEELNEERYFIILMAYDYQLLLKEKKSRLLWITRLSIRSPGNKFEEAIPAIVMIPETSPRFSSREAKPIRQAQGLERSREATWRSIQGEFSTAMSSHSSTKASWTELTKVAAIYHGVCQHGGRV